MQATPKQAGVLRNTLVQSAALWAGLLIASGLALLVLSLPASRAWMVRLTGEEAFLAQVKGLSDLAGDRLRPSLDVDAEATIAHSRLNPFGVNTFLEQEADPAKREHAVRMASEAGYRWLRQEFVWEDIEIHGKGDFEDRRHEPYRSAWEKYDQIVDLAEQHGMEVVVRISNPPEWSRAAGDGPGTFAPPDDPQDFADFMAAVVERYKGRVRYYQLWNEPNIYPEWGSYPISPEDFTRLLKAGSEAAREVDPNVIIIAGALAATINLQPNEAPPANSLSDMVYLQRMYDAGAAPWFDILAVQGYGLWSGPTDHRLHPRVLNIGHHTFLRDLMVANGDGGKPIWLAEMNWNATPEDVEARYGRVSLEQQAEYLPAAYQRILDEWPWIGVASTWYLKRATDEWEQERKPEAYFRLLLPDFTPMPVYDSMKQFATSADLSREEAQ
jgi:hypothetical protein